MFSRMFLTQHSKSGQAIDWDSIGQCFPNTYKGDERENRRQPCDLQNCATAGNDLQPELQSWEPSAGLRPTNI